MSAPPLLGAVPAPHGTTFAVYSTADRVQLCLADGAGERRLPMAGPQHGVWHLHVPDVAPGQLYGYRAEGPWDPAHGQRFNGDTLLVDPYARAVDGEWSVVIDPSFDWGDDRRPGVPWSDTVVYELHVRGFTKLHPAVPEPLRGTYAGLAHPDAVGHLGDLGVTTIELLPVQQFASEPALLARGRSNYWGYNPLAFFAPHGPYAAATGPAERVREFQTMVRDLHRAGLEVVLDVVYNHTCEAGPDGPTRSWRGLADGAYYRHRPGGAYDDVTGCGNSLDLMSPRCLQMVADSLRYWVEVMHVDGFRFDLAPTLARGSAGFDAAGGFLTVVGQDPVLSRVKLIAEPWDLGPGGYVLGGFPAPWVEWNDRFRDTVRETWLGRHGHAHGSVRDLAYRLSGSSDLFADRGPLASMNFITSHDGFTLVDLVSYDRKHNEANGEDGRDGQDHNRSWNCGVEGPTDDPDVLALRGRMMRNLLSTLLLSTGVPMLTAGDETARTQLGNNNAYCIDDGTTWVDWSHEPWQRDLYDWTRALLALRRACPAIRRSSFFAGEPAPGTRKDLAWFGPDGDELTADGWHDHDQRVLGMYVHGPVQSVPGAQALLVLLNTGPADEPVTLPGRAWGASYEVLLDTTCNRPAQGPLHGAGASLTLPARSLLVLAALSSPVQSGSDAQRATSPAW